MRNRIGAMGRILSKWQHLSMFYLSRFMVIRALTRPLLRLSLSRRRLPAAVKVRTYTIFPNLDVEQVVKGVQEDGVSLGLRLPTDLLADILRFTETATRFADQDMNLGFAPEDREKAEKKLNRRFAIARIFNTVVDCPAIKVLTEDPKLWAIATKYLGCVPKFMGVHMYESYAVPVSYAEEDKMAQVFHPDIDDYGFLKFFFYLTDVDGSSGPHVCVKQSHRRRPLLHQLRGPRRYTLSEAERYWGKENILTVTGTQGLGFAEDTFCVHKGSHPKSQDRLLLQFEFGYFEYTRKQFRHKHDDRSLGMLKMILN